MLWDSRTFSRTGACWAIPSPDSTIHAFASCQNRSNGMSAMQMSSHAPHAVHSNTAFANSASGRVSRPSNRSRIPKPRLSCSRMKKTLPRGAADSNPISRYAGHTGTQYPHIVHACRSLASMYSSIWRTPARAAILAPHAFAEASSASASLSSARSRASRASSAALRPPVAWRPAASSAATPAFPAATAVSQAIAFDISFSNA